MSSLEKAKLFYEKMDFTNAIKGAEELWVGGTKTEEVANFLGLLFDQMAMLKKEKESINKLRKKSELYHRQALKIKSKSLNAYLGLGRLFMHSNKFAEAIDYYKKALRINPKSYDAQNGIGNIYNRTGKINLAIQWYKKSLKNAPRKSIILTNIARAYKNSGNIKSAKQFAKKALLELTKEKRWQTALITNLINELQQIIEIK